MSNEGEKDKLEKKLTREQKERLFSEAVARAEREALVRQEAKRDVELQAEQQELFEREKQQAQQRQKLEKEQLRLQAQREEKKREKKEKVEQKRLEKEAALLAQHQIAEEKSAEKKRLRLEKERLFAEAKAKAEQEAEAKRAIEKQRKQKQAEQQASNEQQRREKVELERKKNEAERVEKKRVKMAAAEKLRLEKEAAVHERQHKQEEQRLEKKRLKDEKERQSIEARAEAAREKKKQEEIEQQQQAKIRSQQRALRLEEAAREAELKQAANALSWKAPRPQTSRRPLLIAALLTVMLVAVAVTAIMYSSRARPLREEVDYFAATVTAWQAGDRDAAYSNLEKALASEPLPQKLGVEFSGFIQQVVRAVAAGDLGLPVEAAKKWDKALLLARELEVAGLSAELANIERLRFADAALVSWEKGDRIGTAEALADFSGKDPDLQALPEKVVLLLGEIVDVLISESAEGSGKERLGKMDLREVGNEWEPALRMAVANDGRIGAKLLLAHSIYARDPEVALPYYQDLFRKEAKGESSDRIRFCLRLLKRYPEDEGGFFRDELEKEFENFFAGNQVISTSELLKRISLQDWERSAEQGVAQAAYRLGQIYSSKELDAVRQDDKRALQWFGKAAAEGLLQAEYSLAWMKLNGRGIEGSVEKARLEGFALLDSAEEVERKVLPKFSYQLALCYEKGIGTEVNPAAAKKYYEEALRLFQLKYADGDLAYFRGYALLLAKGSQWKIVGEVLKAGAERNDPASLLMLGSLYFDKKLAAAIRKKSQIEYDAIRGEDLIKRAAVGGDSLAIMTCRKHGWSYKQ